MAPKKCGEHPQTEAKDITKELAESELLESFGKVLEEDEQEKQIKRILRKNSKNTK